MIKRGQSLGILKKNIDSELGIAILLGPLIYRNIFLKHFKQAPRDFETNLADAFLAAFGTAKPSR
jgi:hypothetical protein